MELWCTFINFWFRSSFWSFFYLIGEAKRDRKEEIWSKGRQECFGDNILLVHKVHILRGGIPFFFKSASQIVLASVKRKFGI